MRNKLSLLLLCVLFLLAACTPDTDAVGNKKTLPLDRILTAMQTSDAAMYETAFPPDFCSQYNATSHDLREYVELLLQESHRINADRYGDELSVTYTLTSDETYDVSSLELYMQSVSPEFVYTLPTEHISDAALVTVQTRFDGSYRQEQFDVTYLVLCIDDNWYLHPKHFSTVLKK